MKKIAYILSALILIMTGCNEKTDFTLKGEINGLPSDTLVAFFQIPEYDIDTIICKNGTFEYSFSPDTSTVFTLLIDEQNSIPVYAENGKSVEIKGTTTNFTIQGEGENELMNNIITLLRNAPEEKIKHLTDSLISANPFSFTNLYLMDKYYVRNESTYYKDLEKLIEKQSGIIKDTPYVMDLQSRINTLKNKDKTHSVLSLSGKDREGKPIKWPTTRDNYILIDFWASWHPESVAEQDSLANVLKELKKEKFIVFSVSLDLDKEAWLKVSDRDTTQWRQVCDFKGWNNIIVKNQSIHTLPANLLLDKNKHIIARNIRGQALIDKVKELIQKDKEREKSRNNRKRNR